MRGTQGQARNSLRQIVHSDIDLFTALFPVVLCTPESAAVLFKGRRTYFDLVVFDEASQLRVEDAYASLLKGKTIVVAGDIHQMPPSSWFEANTAVLIEDAEQQHELADLDRKALFAESLLDYAIHDPRFEDTYLDFHYRSVNDALIAFSNAAFYGRLTPMAYPNTGSPIVFNAVNGSYTMQQNPEEARRVVEWLF